MRPYFALSYALSNHQKHHARIIPHRSAFTLIELLVVITVVLILAAVTITSFNYSINSDRMRAGARQFQSLLAGARDKAIYAKEVRGVRLLLDPNDNHAVSGFQYIASPQKESGSLTFDPATTGDTTGFTASLTPVPFWTGMLNRGFLRIGCRIQIPRDTGTWYTVIAIPSPGGNFLVNLNRPNLDLIGSPANVEFVLELAPSVLGDSQPILLPRGVVVDLDGSAIPPSWRPPTFVGAYSPQMDILFSPRGTVVGDCAGLGMLHLHFADATDVLKWHSINGRNSTSFTVPTSPLVPANNMNGATPINVVTRDRILATLSTRTGNVGVYYVDESIVSSNTTTPIASDPFQFAETGKVANK